MKFSNEDRELLTRVLLLALYNKKEEDTIQDVLVELDGLQAISLDESKALLKEIKRDSLFVEGSFTPIGLERVKEAQNFFQQFK
jgi:hypothetical protein